MSTTAAGPSDAEVKSAHRAIWALGDYPRVADDIIPGLGAELVRACGVGAGDRVLDVAAGPGNAALAAAVVGADVVASDLTPALLDVGRAAAQARGLSLEWVAADAEDLPFPDADFDVVVSCVGAMFAPHHQACADELLRVLRPGGRVGLIAWTPEGFVGEMLAAMKPYAAPPPPGAQPPPLWGTEEHVRSLFGSRVGELDFSRAVVRVDRFSEAAEFRDYFKAYYGPTTATYRRIADDPDQVAGLDTALDRLAAEHMARTEGAMEWEYLLVTGTRLPDPE